MNQNHRPLNRVTNKLSHLVHQIQERNESNLILKVVHLWKKHPNEQDQNIMFQRVLYILQLESKQRSTAQLRILEKYFQSDFPYMQKLKEEVSGDLCLKILQEFQLEKHSNMHPVFQQGEVGRKMYFIMEGEVGILIPSMEKQNENNIQPRRSIKTFEDTIQQLYSSYKLIAVKKKFEHFGEIAIEQRVPRTATVITKADCIFATLSYDSYQKVLGWLNERRREEKLKFLSSIPPFKYWSENNQLIFISSCQQIQYQTNQIIYKRHMKGDFLYLIKEGEIIVQKWDKIKNNSSDDENNNIFLQKREEKMSTLGVYSPGQIIGDYELYMAEHIERKQVVRITQAQTRLFTIVFAISITEFLNFIKINQPILWFNNYLKEKYEKKWLIIQDGAKLLKTEVDQKNESSSKKITTIPKLQFLELEDGTQSSKYQVYYRTKHKIQSNETQEGIHTKHSKDFLSPSQMEINSKKDKSMRKYLASSGIFQTKRVNESQSQYSLNQMIRKIKTKVENYKDKFERSDVSILMNQTSLKSMKSMSPISHSPQLSQQIQLQKLLTLPNSLRHITIRNTQQCQYKFQLIK